LLVPKLTRHVFMKRKNKKLITLMLAGLCAVSLSTAVASTTAMAEEAEVKASTYAISEIFSTSGTLDVENDTVAFKLGNEKYARIKRDLAFKWYEGKNDARYLTVKFAFKALNFESITFEVESSSSVANKDQKAVNAVKFTVKEGKVYASVINGEKEGVQQETQIIAGNEVVLALTQGDKFDSFGVTVDGVALNYGEDENGNPIKAEFTNVGANYSDYSLEKMHPLEITAKLASGATEDAVVLLNEINGQLFTGKDVIVDKKVTDTAAPVLVVNEDVNGFQYGTAFSLSYEKVDVLQASSLKEEKKYYRYNPADTATNYDSTLTTSTYFMDTVYYTNGTDVSKEKKDGYKATSVRQEEGGKEYVSIKFTLGDDTYDDTKNADGEIPFAKMTYDLSWYAADTALANKEVGGTAMDFIVIDENDVGATYTHILADEKNAVNVVDSQLDAEAAEYQELLKEEAKDTYAGSNSDFELPAVDWMIKDNGGYRGLKFTISYRTPSSSSAKTASNLSYNNLEIAVTEEGMYEFKVFATDKAGNPMKYYLDGELVNVSTSNIWDIEEIPSFTFTIDNLGIKVEEASSASSRKVEKILDETYTLSGLTVVGATNKQSKYALYRLDTSKYNGPAITTNALTSVKYETIREEAISRLGEVGKADANGNVAIPTYFDLYLDVYAAKVASAINSTKAAVKACFVQVKEYNANITEKDPEWEEYNKYRWNASSTSFKTVEEGEYLILADFWEKELPMQRATAYKVVIVDSKEDVAKGDSKVMAWIKNNVVSVVLFGIAAIMLILIIILLLVKPSDETLDDLDEEVERSKGKKE